MDFQISALTIDQFSHLFGKSDDELAALGVRRVVADADPGYPCRVSLQDAEVGESLLLMNYEHQSASSPFRSSHAIFVWEGAEQARPGENEVPDFLRLRILSVRAFDTDGMMLDADIVDGQKLEPIIDQMFANEQVSYLHVHNAKLGCYAALVERVSDPGQSVADELELQE
jgi:hypothetical protein